jgi:replicative DNA helicase
MADELTKGRTLPHNLEAEKSVLGAILLDNNAINPAAETLTAEDFYGEAHRHIFQAMCALSEDSAPIDAVTLAERLGRSDQLERAGGLAYLSALMDGLPRALNIAQYARIVKDKSSLRNLITSANTIITSAISGDDETDDIIDQAERRIFEIAEDKVKRGFLSIRDLAGDTMHELEELHERSEFITGVPTGFKRLDTMTAGLQGGDLIILAARPSMGKTSLALNIAQHVALRHGGSVGIFSLEMSTQQLIRRLMSAEAQVDNHKLATGFLSDKDLNDLLNALEFLATASIFVDDSANPSLLEMRSKARRLKAEHGLDMLIIDYLQLMSLGRFENRNLEIGAISRALKGLAKELDIPVMALSQLSRAPEARSEHRPQLSDLRECVTGDTLVQLVDGRRIPIEQLDGKTPDVWAMSSDGKLVRAACDKVWKVGRRAVVALRTASGRRLRATLQHRVYSGRGWVRAAELSPGDRIAMPRCIPEPESTTAWPERRVALLGQLIGDGSYLSGQPMRYTTSSEENSELVTVAAREEFGAEVKRYVGRDTWHQLLICGNGNRWHPAGVNRWLRELGVFDQRSHEKRIPKAAFTMPNAQIGLLLQHLWATDGSIQPKTRDQKGTHRAYLATSSPGLAEDVSALLLRLGIVARTYEARKDGYRPGLHIVVQGAASLGRFLREVGAFGPRRAQAERLAMVLEQLHGNTNVDTLPVEVFERVRAAMGARGVTTREMARLRGTSYGGSSHFRFAPSRAMLSEYAELLDNDELRREATSDLFWDRIVSIEPAGEEDVYDLTVPGPASWIGNSIIQHNSGNLEQDADVVAFIYREEVYNPDATVLGLAELIIAKQRNGPIGTVPLAFLKQFTSFKDREDREDPGEPWS